MEYSKDRHKFPRTGNVSDKETKNEERNYCVSLLREDKASEVNNFHVKDITNNKTFWKKLKCSLSANRNLMKYFLEQKRINLSRMIRK